MAGKSHNFTYDVFISLRGEVLRDTFIECLLKELMQKGIKTFIDDEVMKPGDVISPAVSKAIEESKVLIVVFCVNYASSTRCLDELYKIYSRRIGYEQHVFPIFYLIEPTVVRHQSANYAKAMTAHEERFGQSSEKVEAWRLALNGICQISGHHASNRSETIFVEKIVNQIYVKIASKRLHVKHTFGLEQRMKEVQSLIDVKVDDGNVCMLGIYGLGGIGKTELAKALYNNFVDKFEFSSFITNVKEKSKKANGPEDLQKTLLLKMSEVLETELGSTSAGSREIKRRLHKKKILLVIDDVDDTEQLNNLVGGCDWFGSGSIIIITTRDENLLRRHQVKKSYKMVELNDEQSLKLFCHHAFGNKDPKIGYEDISSRAIGYAKGLPLALEVIGSDLRTESSQEDWEHVLNIYKMNQNPRIQDVLKISYERLEPNAKQVFLDIACFFKGERIEYVKRILKELYALRNIHILGRKSLLTFEDGCLNMHDLIQDMGREIVREEAPENPGKRSRLWSHEDVTKVLTGDSGSDKIEGIMLDPPQRLKVGWNGTAFEKMKCLRILIVRNTSFSTEPKDLPNHLRVLDWEEFPSKSFPPKFNPEKIIVFNLRRSCLTLEKPFQKFPSLATMNFSHNECITTMPSVSEVPNLIEIRLDYCNNLIKVDESVVLLPKLVHLSVSGCGKLTDFPRSMHLPSLEVLDLNSCTRLKHFPEIVYNMNQSVKIDMKNTVVEELPDSIGNLTGLTSIEMIGCRKLRYIPHSLFMLKNVVTFKLGGCSNIGESFRNFARSPAAADGPSTLKSLYFESGGLSDEDFDAILKCFPNLEELIALDNNFVSLPECIKECVHLTSLDVSECKELQKIPKCTSLRILNVHLCKKLEEISELPSTIQKVDARDCCSLTRETLDMLWFQVKKEIRRLEVVMHPTEIPDWFDRSDKGGNLCFWARGKFPVVALAFLFSKVIGASRNSRHQLVELQLVINGKRVPRKGNYSFRMEAEHVLVCDLRLLFSEEEWQSLDEFLVHDWNQVQVSYEAPSTMTLSNWGVFAYKNETNMEDVQFVCPDPRYISDMIANSISSPTIVPTGGDPMLEIRKKILEMGLEDTYVNALLQMGGFENGNFEDKEFALEQMNVVLQNLEQMSREAKDVSQGKALDDKSILKQFLDAQEDKSGRIIYFGDLALVPVNSGFNRPIDVEEALRSNSSHVINLHRRDPMMAIFHEGIVDGLSEAQKSFPALDILKTLIATFNKGNRVAWSLPDGLVPPQQMTYIVGIVNGLREAKLSFPTLDVDAILNLVLSKVGLAELKFTVNGGGGVGGVGGEASTSSSHQSFPPMDVETTLSNVLLGMRAHEEMKSPMKVGGASTSAQYQGNNSDQVLQIQRNNPQEEEERRMEIILLKGMRDGLVEAQNMFPTIDIDIIMAATLEKGMRFQLPPTPAEFGELLSTPEMKRYIEGIINALQEAKLSFPTLEVMAILGPVLNKAATMTIFSSGMRKGLVEAKKSFPTLDIEATMNIAACNITRFEGTPVPESEVERLELEKMVYKYGIINGLEEAKLSFPSLDVEAIVSDVLGMRGGHEEMKSPMEVGESSTSAQHQGNNSKSALSGSDLQKDSGKEGCKKHEKLAAVLKERGEELLGLYDAEIEAFQKSQESDHDLMSAVYFQGVRDGVLEAHALLLALDDMDKVTDPQHVTHDDEAPSISANSSGKEGCKGVTKLAAVLKGRGEELQGLYDAGIEAFQNSQESHDLMNAVYLSGQRDGVLEAHTILLALDMDRTL